MDSKEDELHADGHRQEMANENSDTMALQKKRARRVSFAEMTSVHFFDRDDEEYNETPSAQTEKVGDDSSGELEFGKLREGNKEFASEDDGDENYDDDEMEMRRSFLRPIGSPSPGGSTFGSASSNDEDNFFGPVSANFIRPGRLSDSAASDDNHDVTMDSTAFSMHYRSLAMSESGVDLKTPTGGQLFFEEKTPKNPSVGSSMDFTLGKKPIPISSVPVTEVSGTHNSNDMSLVGENPNKYDYDKLSPGLDALLAESGKNLLSVSVSDDIITSISPGRNEGEVFTLIDDGDNIVNLSHDARKEAVSINSPDVPNGGESAGHSKLHEASGPADTFPNDLSPEKTSASVLCAATFDGNSYKANRSPYQLGNDESKTSLVPSTSPVGQQILVSTASPSKHLGVATPLPEHPGSLLRNENLEHQETETSIQKSISKLELLEKSTFSSTFSAKVDKSTVKLLDFSKSPNFSAFLEKRHISRINFIQDSVTKNKCDSIHQNKEETHALTTVRAETLNHMNLENHFGKTLGQIASRESPHELRANNSSVDQLKYKATSASPSKISLSGNNLMRSLFTFKHSDEDALVTETESLLAEIASVEGGKAILTTSFSSSPSRLLEKKVAASPGLHYVQSENSLLQSQFKQISGSDKAQDSSPDRNLADVSLSSVNAYGDALPKGSNGELSSCFFEVNCPNDFIGTDDGEVDFPNRGKILVNIDNFPTPAKVNKSQVMHSRIMDVVSQTNLEISPVKDNLPREDLTTIVHGSVSPSARRNLIGQRLQNPDELLLPTTSPSRQELDDERSSRLYSPGIAQLSGGLEKISANKRNIELLLRDAQHRTEMTIMQRSPKFQKGDSSDPERLFYPYEGKRADARHERKNWTETYSKYVEDMKVLTSESAGELNSKMIDMLELLLIHQQKSKIYEMLHVGVMPQNKHGLRDPQLEKIAETNTLLHRLVFEKAKLHLKHVKRERLLRRLEIFSSRIQESEKLGATILPRQFETCSTKLQVDAVDDRPLSINLKKGHEVCPEKLTAMRQGLENLDRKILNLTRTFHTSCKLKAEPGCTEIISLVNQHLMKRAFCRFLRLDMQMWVVHNVGTENCQHNIVLNFLDFVIQSIKVFGGPISTVTTSFKLNETNIVKNFPNVDASIAFAFVLNAENSRKYLGAKTLAQETQVTSSLLGTLMDVLEEVQLAQLEFQNLLQSGFSSPSVEQLDLMLCFFNFNSGMKVILKLDMSCLKRGIYPSDTIPLQVASPIDSQKSSFCGPIFDEIRDTVKGVRTGHMRILRLCGCISKLVQASNA